MNSYKKSKGISDMNQLMPNKLLPKKKLIAAAYIVPTILIILVIIVYPFSNVINLSFTNKLFTYDNFGFVGLQNYNELYRDKLFWHSLKNSFKVTFIGVSGSLVIGLLLALLLNKKAAYINVFRGLLFIPWTLPSIVVALTFRWMYNDYYGYINYILVKYNIIENRVNLLAEPDLALYGVIIPIIWCSYPFSMVILLASLQSIDKNIYEAAELDGAGRWQMFRYITLPLLKSSIFIIIILQFIWVFSSFDLIYILTRGGPQRSTLTLSLYIFIQAFEHFELGYAAALAVTMVLVLLIFTIWYFKVIDTGKIYGRGSEER